MLPRSFPACAAALVERWILGSISTLSDLLAVTWSFLCP
jgi:hypothetical protein